MNGLVPECTGGVTVVVFLVHCSGYLPCLQAFHPPPVFAEDPELSHPVLALIHACIPADSKSMLWSL